VTVHKEVTTVKRKKRYMTSTFAAEVEPVVDDRASFAAEDAAQDVVPRVSSVLLTGAAKSMIKIHRDLGRSQGSGGQQRFRMIWTIVG
jgi:hypothetical protein